MRFGKRQVISGLTARRSLNFSRYSLRLGQANYDVGRASPFTTGSGVKNILFERGASYQTRPVALIDTTGFLGLKQKLGTPQRSLTSLAGV